MGESLVRAMVLGVALSIVGVVRLVLVHVLLVGSMCGGEWGWMGGSVAMITI